MRVGIIGCGNISDVYATNSRLFKDIDIVACADVSPQAADRVATKFALRKMSVDDLLSANDIDIVLNLTIPTAHAEVSRAALAAGKHVYTEKPLATTLEDGVAIVETAERNRLRVGSAPDTFLGAGLQSAKKKIDQGEVGTVLSGLAVIMSRGMEHWHPNPAFFYQKGGGPVLDIGPYYISALVALLGPIMSVRATGQISPLERRYGAEGPNKGKIFPVETFTTINAVLTFASGANISFIASWDIWRHGVRPIELYGTLASLRVPDPDTFGGEVEVSGNHVLLNMHDPEYASRFGSQPEWNVTQTVDTAFGGINYPFASPSMANYRSLGLAEMANAILQGRPHRCSGRLSLHVLAAMLAILESATTGEPVAVAHGRAAPAPFGPDESVKLLKAPLAQVSGAVSSTRPA
jgi:predicted dehydrogenase